MQRLISPKLLANIALRSPRSIGVRNGLTTLLKILTRRGTLSLPVSGYPHPLLARNATSDIEVFTKVFVKREYRSFVKDARCIIDLGANVGYAAVYFARHYPAARVIAVEPEANNFALLRQNTRHYPQITAIQAAVWPHNTPLQIVNPADPSWSFRVAEQRAAGPATTQAITMPELIALSGCETVDILKVDIESAELELFAEQTAPWLHRVRVIVIELHDNIRPGCSQSFYRAVGRGRFNQFVLGENLVVVQEPGG